MEPKIADAVAETIADLESSPLAARRSRA